jgi:hypothetical protein
MSSSDKLNLSDRKHPHTISYLTHEFNSWDKTHREWPALESSKSERWEKGGIRLTRILLPPGPAVMRWWFHLNGEAFQKGARGEGSKRMASRSNSASYTKAIFEQIKFIKPASRNDRWEVGKIYNKERPLWLFWINCIFF